MFIVFNNNVGVCMDILFSMFYIVGIEMSDFFVGMGLNLIIGFVFNFGYLGLSFGCLLGFVNV